MSKAGELLHAGAQALAGPRVLPHFLREKTNNGQALVHLVLRQPDKVRLTERHVQAVTSAAYDVPGEQFDIDFTLMTGELAALLGDLAKALGEPEQKQAAAA